MRLPRVRFTIRWMMIAVAGTGTIFGACIELQHRHDRFSALADYHEASSSVTWACSPSSYSATNDHGEDVRKWSSERIRWHILLGEKYRGAASRPWMPVEDDPPEPQ